MALPSTNTNSILVSDPTLVPTPAAGFVTYFFNTADNTNLYYKDDAGNIHLADNTVAGIDDCVCDLTKKWLCGLNDALQSGIMTPAEYGTQFGHGIDIVTPQGTYTVKPHTP